MTLLVGGETITSPLKLQKSNHKVIGMIKQGARYANFQLKINAPFLKFLILIFYNPFLAFRLSKSSHNKPQNYRRRNTY